MKRTAQQARISSTNQVNPAKESLSSEAPLNMAASKPKEAFRPSEGAGKILLCSKRDQVIDQLIREKTDFKFKDAFWVQERERITLAKKTTSTLTKK